MSSTTKQRISARGWLTRAARALSDLVHENADKVALVEPRGDSRLRQADRHPRQHTGACRSRAGRRRTVCGHREGGRFP